MERTEGDVGDWPIVRKLLAVESPLLDQWLTFPFLSDIGKTPIFKEVFIISVIGLARTSVDCFKTRVGKGSRQHDLGFDFSISSLI